MMKPSKRATNPTPAADGLVYFDTATLKPVGGWKAPPEPYMPKWLRRHPR